MFKISEEYDDYPTSAWSYDNTADRFSELNFEEDSSENEESESDTSEEEQN